MRRKYTPKIKQPHERSPQGRCEDPNSWIVGPDPLRREKYYAWLKHRAQARFRHETYELTWDEWEQLWSDELFLKRGRSIESMCASRIDCEAAWTIDNTEIITRKQHFKKRRGVTHGR